jgi:hypothetical protein
MFVKVSLPLYLSGAKSAALSQSTNDRNEIRQVAFDFTSKLSMLSPP